MALDKATLKQGIINLTEQLFEEADTMTPAEAREAFADGLSNLIEAFVKSGDGKYQAGSLTSPSGAVTGVGTVQIKIQ